MSGVRPQPTEPNTSDPMSSPSNVVESPITQRQTLVDHLAAGGRARTDWRIGTEHEKFGFRLDDLRPPTFDGERGIEALLKGLVRFGWQPVEEHGRVIALTRDGASAVSYTHLRAHETPEHLV